MQRDGQRLSSGSAWGMRRFNQEQAKCGRVDRRFGFPRRVSQTRASLDVRPLPREMQETKNEDEEENEDEAGGRKIAIEWQGTGIARRDRGPNHFILAGERGARQHPASTVNYLRNTR